MQVNKGSISKEIPAESQGTNVVAQRHNDSVTQYEMSCDSNLPLALTPRQIADENNQRRNS